VRANERGRTAAAVRMWAPSQPSKRADVKDAALRSLPLQTLEKEDPPVASWVHLSRPWF
jgi:hypothetical protein